jgi:hypothetical protein
MPQIRIRIVNIVVICIQEGLPDSAEKAKDEEYIELLGKAGAKASHSIHCHRFTSL